MISRLLCLLGFGHKWERIALSDFRDEEAIQFLSWWEQSICQRCGKATDPWEKFCVGDDRWAQAFARYPARLNSAPLTVEDIAAAIRSLEGQG